MKTLKYSLALLIALSFQTTSFLAPRQRVNFAAFLAFMKSVSPQYSISDPDNASKVRVDQSLRQNSGPIIVGYFGDLSGRTSNFGISTKNGIEMAAEEINDSGGVNGRQIEILSEDDEGRPEKAAAVAAKLIDHGNVIALLGTVSSTNTLAAAPKAQHALIPMISPSATNPAVTQIGDYIFRVCFIDPFQGEVMAKFALNTLKVRRAAILLDSSSQYNAGLTDQFEAKFMRLSGKVVNKQFYAQGDRDFKRQLRAIRLARPDVIYVPGYYDQVAMIATQAKQLGMVQPLLGGDGWDSQQLWDIGGKALNGDFISHHYSPDDPSPAVQKFAVAYKTRYGDVPDALAALGYDAMGVLADAIHRAETTEGPILRQAISLTRNYPGVTGPISIDAKRNAVKPAVVLKLQNGKFIYQQRIYPDSMMPPATVNVTAARMASLPAVIAEVYMARDNPNRDPEGPIDRFNPSDRTIYCVTKLKKAKSGTKLKFSWWAVDVEGAQNEKIMDNEYTTRTLENVIHAHLTLPRDWPKGKYKVNVYLNGYLKKTAYYDVE